MNTETRTRMTVGIAVALCLAALPAVAAELAAMRVENSTIFFTPKASGYYDLRVGGPGEFYFVKEFRGEMLSLSVFTEEGGVLPDGVYRYELTRAARPRIRGVTRAAPAGPRAVQWGSFTVLDGAFVSGGPAEGEIAPDSVPTKDVLHYDDVIITGSLCVGFDCQNGESFGFDTIILKEHNLRIYFNDTSYSASYPTNGWRITINDSTNGGASYFSVDDVDDGTSIFKIEAGAPSNSLYVEDYGRVGLGTSTPVVELHVKDSDTPTLRLEQDSSGGWTAQTWDVAGNESNFFVRDATNGSKLPFRIQPSTPSSTLCLKSDGNVGIGTWSPDADLHIHVGTSEAANFRASGDSASFDLQDLNGPSDEKVAQHFVNSGVWRVRGLDDAMTSETVTGISLDLGNGNVGINEASPGYELELGSGAYVDALGRWRDASSRRYKDGITELAPEDALEVFEALNPVSYFRKGGDPHDRALGFIAEDVPELVVGAQRQGLAPMDFVAVLTKVVQEQQRIIQAQ